MSTDTLTLSISDIPADGGVRAAILAACEEHDSLASGIIGPSFACSGPGSGWQRDYDVCDYAERALGDEGGCTGYIDADDGRLATLGEDESVEWTEESVVELTCPDEDDALADPAALAEMCHALIRGQCVPDSREAWVTLVERIKAAAEALDGVDVDDLRGGAS